MDTENKLLHVDHFYLLKTIKDNTKLYILNNYNNKLLYIYGSLVIFKTSMDKYEQH